MRDILQSRYLRSNVAHKQLARTSLSNHDNDGKGTSQICIFNNENNSFARFVRAFFIFVHFVVVRTQSTTFVYTT